MRFVNEAVDLPYQKDSITAELVRHHADSLVRTSSKVSASFGEDVRNWEREILERFKNGPVPNRLRYHLHVLDLDGVMFLFSDGEPFCEYQMDIRKDFPDGRSSSPATQTGRIPIFRPKEPTRCARVMNMRPSRCTSTSRPRTLSPVPLRQSIWQESKDHR